LAKINADRPDESQSHLKKKLWLKIAKHTVLNKKDIKSAMESLKQCPLLKLEDILLFFPDFVLINDFQQEICAALEDYNQDIDQLKSELNEAIKSAESIRIDIRELKHRFAKFSVVKTCELCTLPCLIRQFYLFPCEHAYHSDCLSAEVVRNSAGPKARRIKDLQTRMKSEMNIKESSDEVIEQIKDSLDELVAEECLLCGESMIKTIDLPFTDGNESL
jgi:hypothetical protein